MPTATTVELLEDMKKEIEDHPRVAQEAYLFNINQHIAIEKRRALASIELLSGHDILRGGEVVRILKDLVFGHVFNEEITTKCNHDRDKIDLKSEYAKPANAVVLTLTYKGVEKQILVLRKLVVKETITMEDCEKFTRTIEDATPYYYLIKEEGLYDCYSLGELAHVLCDTAINRTTGFPTPRAGE